MLCEIGIAWHSVRGEALRRLAEARAVRGCTGVGVVTARGCRSRCGVIGMCPQLMYLNEKKQVAMGAAGLEPGGGGPFITSGDDRDHTIDGVMRS